MFCTILKLPSLLYHSHFYFTLLLTNKSESNHNFICTFLTILHHIHFAFNHDSAFFRFSDDNQSRRSQSKEVRDPGLWRDLFSYWLFGLCNNFGYVVMLTAAHDIIDSLAGDDNANEVSIIKALILWF